jgi:hypothetical protein
MGIIKNWGKYARNIDKYKGIWYNGIKVWYVTSFFGALPPIRFERKETMNTKFMRLIVMILALVMCLGLCAGMVACDNGEDPVGPGPGPVGPGTTGRPDKEEVPHSVEAGKNFSTYTNNVVNVLHYTTEGNHEGYVPWDEICPSTGMEASPGDLVGDMIYDRTAWLEEQYSIVMGCEYLAHGPEFVTRVRTLVETTSQDYQMVDYFAFGAQKLMGQDYFLNMSDIEYIDFEDPWWVDSAIDALSLGNYVEFAASDMLLLDKGATTLLYYNIGLAEDLGIEDLYDLVRNNEWTIDALAEYAELALEENGDDVWDHNDRWGISNGDDPVHNLYIGSGYKFISKDEDGNFYYQYRYTGTELHCQRGWQDLCDQAFNHDQRQRACDSQIY